MTRLVFAFLLELALQAQAPDRTPLSDEWGYRPADGSTVAVNPPSLTWVAEKGVASYEVQWAQDSGFRGASSATVPWTVYTHSAPLKAGKWWWRYRIRENWSKARAFTVPSGAAVFPQPTMEQLDTRIPKDHPRVFVRRQDLPRLKEWARGKGKPAMDKLLASADALAGAEPTPEPAVKASAHDPGTNQFWWSNRMQAIKALHEAEVLSFAWLLTGEKKYGDAARRFTLRLAAWDPDGPTSFKLNCEAAKPMIHRLARAYDWAWPLLSGEERKSIQAVLLRRAKDAWVSGEVKEGGGHLNQPYSSHGNRTWHKLAELALATYREVPESELYLRYAVAKFFAAYPVWSDDDGGWHEGLSYFAGYMVKTRWWMDIAQNALGIDGFRKPFFAHFGDYPLYSAPPGTPDLGLGDLAFGRPGRGWAFMHYYVRRTRNPYWAWWLNAWNVPAESEEPVLDVLWSAAEAVAPKPPADLPPSKVFRGTGVAILNNTLLDAADNVQVRFKSSPMGRWSHGHDPHNSFTLNAYGEALIVNNVYRDLYGSPFHKGWVWSTRAQNAVLADGQGQKMRSADPDGQIVKFALGKDLDFVTGDATPAYEGKLKRARRHVVFVKPDVVVIADDLEAPRPGSYQFMLHGHQAFEVDEAAQRLVLERGAAGVVVDYASERPLKIRQWTGYDPEPDNRYLSSIGRSIPPQWHVEAASTEPAARSLTLTVLRPYRRGHKPGGGVEVNRLAEGIVMRTTSAAGKPVVVNLSPAGDLKM